MSLTPTIDSILLGITPNPDQPSTYIQNLLQLSAQCAKLAQALPTDADYAMYMEDPTTVTTANTIAQAGERVWGLIAEVGAAASHNLQPYTFLNTQRSTEKYHIVQHALNDALEQSNIKLRLINKLKKNDYSMNRVTVIQSESFSIPVTNTFSKAQLRRMAERNDARSVGHTPTKPQLLYSHKVDNSYTPFRPVLRHKPNALTPLHPTILQGQLPPTMTSYPHPYKEEILHFELEPSQLQHADVLPVAELKDTPCFWIDTVEDLLLLEQCLCQQDFFSIDLEHHNQHSYQGVTCLVQISTPSQDFIIDALVLREKMSILNSSFTNPSIVKVLHGCNMDVIWLQRDLGLYLVNIFDTSQAARVLDFPKANLAALLDHYCGVRADKSYQLSDWRQRPLNREMMVYAREDTHYLLHIYHQMKNELIDRSTDLLEKHHNIETVYGKEPLLNVRGLGKCATTLRTAKNQQNAVQMDDGDEDQEESISAPVINSALSIPYLLAIVLQRSNRIPLTQYEKDNRPVLAARRLYHKLRIFETLPSNETIETAEDAVSDSIITNPTEIKEAGANDSTTATVLATPITTATSATTTSNTSLTLNDTPSLNNEDDSLLLRLFCAIYAWRDQKARELDQSPGSILKNDYLIRICQYIPTTMAELEQRVKPVNIFLRPLLVPLFHLIQSVLQLPPNIFSLDFSALTFVDANNNDFINNYSNSLDSPQDDDMQDDDRGLSSLKTVLKSQRSQLKAIVDENMLNDPYLVFTSPNYDDLIDIPPTITVTPALPTIAPPKNEKSVKNTKKLTVKGKKEELPPPSVTTVTTQPSGRVLTDEQINLMQRYLRSCYHRVRYSHPLYFVPEYLRSLLTREWSQRSGISDDLEDDAQALVQAAGWNKSTGLPEFPQQRDALARLNFRAAKGVHLYALSRSAQAGNPNGVPPNLGGFNDPKTAQGVSIFSLGSLGEDYRAKSFGESGPDNSNTNVKISMQFDEDFLNDEVLNDTDMGDNVPISNINMLDNININLPSLTTSRLEAFNEAKVNSLKSEVVDSSINVVGNAVLTSTLTKPCVTADNNINNIHTLPYQKKNITSIINTDTLGLQLPHSITVGSEDGISNDSTLQPPDTPFNPVAAYQTFDELNSFVSPPRHIGSCSNPLSTITPLNEKSKLCSIGSDQAHSQLDQLSWDNNHSEVTKNTPITGRIRPDDGNSSKHTNMTDSSDFDGSDDDFDDRIPNVVKMELSADVPAKLGQIYKISNMKKSQTIHKNGEIDDEAHLRGKKGKEDKSALSNPFNPSEILLTTERFKAMTSASDEAFLASTGYTRASTQEEIKREVESQRNIKDHWIKNHKDDDNQDMLDVDDAGHDDDHTPHTGGNNKTKRNNKNRKNKQVNVEVAATAGTTSGGNAPTAETTAINPFLSNIDASNPFLNKQKSEFMQSLGSVSYNPRNIKADYKDPTITKSAATKTGRKKK